MLKVFMEVHFTMNIFKFKIHQSFLGMNIAPDFIKHQIQTWVLYALLYPKNVFTSHK